jgi:hypothetical protein
MALGIEAKTARHNPRIIDGPLLISGTIVDNDICLKYGR